MKPTKKEVILCVTEIFSLDLTPSNPFDDDSIAINCSNQTCETCSFSTTGNDYCREIDEITIQEARDILMKYHPERLV